MITSVAPALAQWHAALAESLEVLAGAGASAPATPRDAEFPPFAHPIVREISTFRRRRRVRRQDPRDHAQGQHSDRARTDRGRRLPERAATMSARSCTARAR